VLGSQQGLVEFYRHRKAAGRRRLGQIRPQLNGTLGAHAARAE
jgi:hypothetical protein